MNQIEPKSAVRIAMWSGPRNVSTAMMRSWENRPDTVVVDEPFYAHYLSRVPVNHPGRDQIIASQECDWRVVAGNLTGPIPEGKPVYFQKHMSHHLLPHMGRDWLGDVSNALLIREPKDALMSLNMKLDQFSIQETGLPGLVEIFNFVCDQQGEPPPVLDSQDLLADPEGMLRKLCDRLQIPFYPSMLSWPPGKRDTDGIWARYWYGAVENSSGFASYKVRGPLPQTLEKHYEECLEYYDILYKHRIKS